MQNFITKAKEAIGDQLDPDYVAVKLGTARMTESGDVAIGDNRFSADPERFAAEFIRQAPMSLRNRTAFYDQLKAAAKHNPLHTNENERRRQRYAPAER